MRFANPIFLLLLGIVPLLIVYYKQKSIYRGGALKFSNLKQIRKLKRSKAARYRVILPILRIASVVLLIIAFARPQHGSVDRNITTEGIDIILALDVSLSMQAQDFQPNRLEKAKEVVAEFISGRKYDRIGLVVFGSTSFTLCPLTPDYGVLKEFLSKVDFGIVDGNSTAIGTGLATSVDRLRNSKADSKIVILLTDGENNAGKINPITAADVAQALGVRTYTIGVGSEGETLIPVDHPLFGRTLRPIRTHIDEETLKQIADKTDAKYFRATDGKKLEQIYEAIDKMETTEIKVKEHINYAEKMHFFVIPGLLLLLFEILLANTRFLKLP